MDRQTLAALEEAIEPYRRMGFIVTSQSEGAITLGLPPEKFSYLLFITLLLIWPLAVLYLVSYNIQREKTVCLRVTSQGYIEVSGYTLEVVVKERRRRKLLALMILSASAIVIILILVRVFSGER